MAETKQFKVVDGPLSVRKTPQGIRTGAYIATGQLLQVDPDSRTEASGYVWWQHAQGWSAERVINGDVYMVEATATTETTPSVFKVIDGPLSIRSAAAGARLTPVLSIGQTVEVDPTSRKETSGYVWWQHAQGWSAERNMSGTQIFLQAISTDETQTDTPTDDNSTTTPDDPQQPPEQEPQIDLEGLLGLVSMQSNDTIKVRSQPSTAANVLIIRSLIVGEAISANFDDVREANGFYWVQHQDGWSAWKSIDGKTRFLVKAGSDPKLIAVGPNGPEISDLPGYQTLITQLPVPLDQIQWWQYFGNNSFAYVNGKNFNYDGYSQGLHAGLDFGNSTNVGVPVYAGLEAEFVKIERRSRRNFKVYLKQGDYTIIYQHVTNMVGFTPGQTISAGTKIAEIESRSQNGGYDHLHFEIRFRNKWIINPLALMATELIASLVTKFDPNRSMPPNSNLAKSGSQLYYFFKTGGWTQWTTPLEQPVIKLAGPVVGPRGG